MEGQVGEKGQVIAGLWGSSEGLSLGGVGGKRGWGAEPGLGWGAEPGVGWEAACPKWVRGKRGWGLRSG